MSRYFNEPGYLSGQQFKTTRAFRRKSDRGSRAVADVVTSRAHCCTAPEKLSEELYSGTSASVLVKNCCDGVNGCGHKEERSRCEFWPSFAHPRWLKCDELYNRATPCK